MCRIRPLWFVCVFLVEPVAAQCIPRWQPVGGGLGDIVNALTLWDPDGAGPMAPVLVAGGNLQIAGSTQPVGVAVWSGTEWSALGNLLGVRSLSVFQDTLFASGLFSAGIVQWNGAAWQPVGSGPGGIANALTVYGGELIAGGSFFFQGADAGVLAWSGSTWHQVGDSLDRSRRLRFSRASLLPEARSAIKPVFRREGWPDGTDWLGTRLLPSQMLAWMRLR
jgi:hypothetical protein